MSATKQSQCRLYAILARDGRSAVVFRRGPSRHVLVLRWWLHSDRIEVGQWFKGRIYERRCDLSPDGDFLLCFAAKWRAPIASWTAISRTPFLTALALWPKNDAWGGGGLLDGPSLIRLNHAPRQQQLAPGFDLPRGARVQSVASWAGNGEDDPIERERLRRDGWESVQDGEAGPYGNTKGYAWVLQKPEMIMRAQPSSAHGGATNIVLKRELKAIGKQDGPWYVEDYLLAEAGDRELRRFVECSWADFDHKGNLLFAEEGKLFRLPKSNAAASVTNSHDGAELVADLSGYEFSPQPAPSWATHW